MMRDKESPPPVFHHPHQTQAPPPVVVADTSDYYYRNVNGDRIRVGGISISPLRSPAALLNDMRAADRKQADILINVIVDQIINGDTTVMPAEIYHWRIRNDNVMSMVTEYFQATPYQITKTLTLGNWKWFVAFREDSEGLVDPHTRNAPASDAGFLICCVLVVVMLSVRYLYG